MTKFREKNMTYIPQKQLHVLANLLSPGKVVVLYGARRTGKTTLLNRFLNDVPIKRERILFVNGDDIIVRQYLESQSINTLRDFVGNHTLLVIDEAQYIHTIGLNLKLIVDHMPHLKIIATGSSSFSLAKDIGEPLTGRKYTLKLYSLAQMEIAHIEKPHETTAHLETRLIYGSYPEVVTLHDNKRRETYLRELVSSYLFKDILELEGIRHSQKLTRLLQLIAFQIGKGISMNELGAQLGMSKNTVERYLDLLEKVFVIFHRSGFNRNLRKEITKGHRFYFYDTGIRNALIGNFNPVTIRNDIGQLWENYIVCERMKANDYLKRAAASYFWRTYDKKEIDLVEEKQGELFGFEIKWQQTKAKVPKDWVTAYHGSHFTCIHRENYLPFITS
jgi:predicted AAA+ superfamily ATPase